MRDVSPHSLIMPPRSLLNGLQPPHQVAQSKVETFPASTTWAGRAKSASKTVFLHVTKHVGVGIICSVAYFDP